jgi:hypothetical protein
MRTSHGVRHLSIRRWSDRKAAHTHRKTVREFSRLIRPTITTGFTIRSGISWRLSRQMNLRCFPRARGEIRENEGSHRKNDDWRKLYRKS